MLRVKAIPGESTRFFVESGTLTCVNPKCGATYNRRTRHRLVADQRQPTDYLHIGDPCPACSWRWMASWKRQELESATYLIPGEKLQLIERLESLERVGRLQTASDKCYTLDVRFHLVDIAANNLNGQCSCEFFSFVQGPALAKLLPSERAMGKCRCSHIEAARAFALDLSLKYHDLEQHKDAHGQREETQP